MYSPHCISLVRSYVGSFSLGRWQAQNKHSTTASTSSRCRRVTEPLRNAKAVGQAKPTGSKRASPFKHKLLPVSRRTIPYRNLSCAAANSDADKDTAGLLAARLADPARTALLAGWAAFLGYAFVFAPNSAEGSAADIAAVEALIATPFSGSVNALFEAQFNSLGVMPAVYAALLFPGAKDQKPVPTLPFVAGSFALGYFALGPYLVAREARPKPVSRSSLGFVTRNIFEAKWNALLLLAFATFLTYWGVSHISSESIAEYVQMWHTQALVNVSSVDLCVLSVAIYNPLVEDMQRRGWGDRTAIAAAFCLLPVIGPATYLLVRPALEE